MTVTEQDASDGIDDRTRKRMEFSRALVREGYDDVLTISRETARELLGAGRLEIVDRLRDGSVESVRALAEDLGRDKAGVSRDLKTLAEHDVIEYEERGRAKIPTLKHETVVVEPIV